MSARGPGLAVFFAVGLWFGFVITRGEVISWYRVQEMFRFQGIHLLGVFALAMLTATVTVQAMKRAGVRTLTGEEVRLTPKTLGRGVRYVAGGTLFGLGWALTGACPGPLLAHLGAGVSGMFVAVFCALVGTWTYAWLRPRLPH